MRPTSQVLEAMLCVFLFVNCPFKCPFSMLGPRLQGVFYCFKRFFPTLGVGLLDLKLNSSPRPVNSYRLQPQETSWSAQPQESLFEMGTVVVSLMYGNGRIVCKQYRLGFARGSALAW